MDSNADPAVEPPSRSDGNGPDEQEQVGFLDGDVKTVFSEDDRNEPVSKRYDIRESLGAGAFGEVYLANHRKLKKRQFAIKRLKLDKLSSLGSADFLKRAEQSLVEEARTLEELYHGNIINILDTGMDQDGPYIVMEYAPGGTLREMVHQKGPVDAETVADWGRQLAKALAVIHAKDIFHRDLKPGNILFSQSNTPKIGDFGLAMDRGTGEQGGTFRGTPGYMSPEQEFDSSRVDARSDIYSLAAVLYYAATGKSPEGKDWDALPEPLRAPLARAMEENPEKRFATAELFANGLKEAYLTLATEQKAANAPSRSYECYNCRNDVPYEALYCPSCGKDLHALRKQRETEIKNNLASAKRDIKATEFAQADKTLKRVASLCVHDHFAGLRPEVNKLRAQHVEAKKGAEEKLEQLQKDVRKAQRALDDVQLDEARKLAEGVAGKRASFFLRPCSNADKIIKKIKSIEEKGALLKARFEKACREVDKHVLHDEFSIARTKLSKLISDIDGRYYPELKEKAQARQDALQIEKQSVEEEKEQFRAALSAAESLLSGARIDDAIASVDDLLKLDKPYLRDIVRDAGKLEKRIIGIFETKQKIAESLGMAADQAQKEEYDTALGMLDEILKHKSDHYTKERAEAKERYREYSEAKTRCEYRKLIALAQKDKKQMAPLKAVADDTRAFVREQSNMAARMLRRRMVFRICKLSLLLLVVAGVFALPRLRLAGRHVTSYAIKTNVRSGPSASSRINGTINDRDKMWTLWLVPTSSGTIWVKVFSSSVQGYINAKLLRDSSNGFLVRSAELSRRTNVFWDNDSRIYPAGTSLRILDKIIKNNKIWFRVKIRGNTGLVRYQDVKLKL